MTIFLNISCIRIHNSPSQNYKGINYHSFFFFTNHKYSFCVLSDIQRDFLFFSQILNQLLIRPLITKLGKENPITSEDVYLLCRMN